MQDILQKARKAAGLTQEQAAKQMFMAKRAYQALEYGEKLITQDEALKLAKVFACPALAMVYCRKGCAIGKVCRYEVLNCVDQSIPGILLKLHQEYREAERALEEMSYLVVNKRFWDDFSEGERGRLEECLHRLLNLEHSIEILKVQLDHLGWLNLWQLIREHNFKCYERGYVVNLQDRQQGKKNLYERGNADGASRVEESFMFYRQEQGFSQVAGCAKVH